mmetsp:Transcript_11476/g.26552  ORF Transcript_11476/g.26552 Transcript_11476/m.26552 type:complete len:226 (-) Transcript_11476:944-1621(-)
MYRRRTLRLAARAWAIPRPGAQAPMPSPSSFSLLAVRWRPHVVRAPFDKAANPGLRRRYPMNACPGPAAAFGGGAAPRTVDPLSLVWIRVGITVGSLCRCIINEVTHTGCYEPRVSLFDWLGLLWFGGLVESSSVWLVWLFELSKGFSGESYEMLAQCPVRDGTNGPALLSTTIERTPAPTWVAQTADRAPRWLVPTLVPRAERGLVGWLADNWPCGERQAPTRS